MFSKKLVCFIQVVDFLCVELFIVFPYPFDVCRICGVILCSFLYFFSVLNFINFCSSLFPSFCLFWFYFTLLFLGFLFRSLDYWFETLHSFSVLIQCYKFPFQHCFSYVPQSSLCCIFIFIPFNVFLKISLENSSLNHEL